MGLETAIASAIYLGGNWTYYSPVTAASNQAVATVAAFGDLTGRTNHSVISVATGSWNTAGTWNIGRVPGATDSVAVAAGHTIDFNVAGATCAGLSIAFTGTLRGTTTGWRRWR